MNLRQELESILLAHRPRYGEHVIDDDGELAFEKSDEVFCSCNPSGPSSGFADYHEWARHVVDQFHKPIIDQYQKTWKHMHKQQLDLA